ncbi:MAG: 50S ribosomal protein L25 [Candidatus Dojkabacteria bacterium]|nr:MAG: 50S ribosomal protein L25 [Candidatus Dojkabacteria bacterium]
MKLKAQKRTLVGKKVKQLRDQGQVPSVVFGPNFESVNITINEKDFLKIFDQVEYNKFIDLEIEGEDKPLKVLVKEVQKDFLKDNILTVNFYKIDDNRKISVEVPINLVGEAPAVKMNLGFLVQNMDSILVHCYPKDVPNEFEVDISSLNQTGDSLTVQVLNLPEGVELDSGIDPTTAIAYIAARQKEIEVATTSEEEVEGEETSEAEGDSQEQDGGNSETE